MAVRTEAGLERQDMMLTFGEIAVSASGTKTFGATTDYADGVIVDCGATNLGGMSVCINVTAAAAGGTQTFALLKAEDEKGETWNTIATTGAIAAANLAKGESVSLPIPRESSESVYQKYKLQVISGSGTTAGTFYAYVDTYVGV